MNALDTRETPLTDEPPSASIQKKHRHHQRKHRHSATVETLDEAKTVVDILPASTLNSEIEISDNLGCEKGENRPTKSNDGQGEHAEVSVNWNPTIASELSHTVTGHPCRKPSKLTVKTETRETNRKNQLIISSNIRRKKLIVWMMIFTLALTWNGFADQLQRILEENKDTFSIDIIKPWFIPILAVEFAMTAVGLLFMIMKMKFMQDKCISRMFRVLTGINNIQYLIAMLALPFGIYFFFTELSTDMKKALVDSKNDSILGNWNATQFERQCCGFNSRNDWKLPPMEEFVVDPEGYDEDFEIDVLYPSTCCNLTAVAPEHCTELSKTYWNTGCHDKEFYVILDYIVCFVALLLLTLTLNVAARIWIDKTERYLIIFRPYEIF